MSAPTASYAQSQAYIEYTSLTQRPDDLMPRLQTNQNGEIWIAPGERYCRHLVDGVHLCSKSHKFGNASALRMHYRTVHSLRIELRPKGRLNVLQDCGLALWYHDLMAGRTPMWNPYQYRGPATTAEPPSDRVGEDDEDEGNQDDEDDLGPRRKDQADDENNFEVGIESVVENSALTAHRAASSAQAQTQGITPEAEKTLSAGEKRSFDRMNQDQVDGQVEPESSPPSEDLPINAPTLPSGELDIDQMRALAGIPAGHRCSYCISRGKCKDALFFSSLKMLTM
ncbi:hypothetical protein FDECE_7361 [Fusarium decemcellulare]|nr:hypothetical protein FDECE_7361 [Fusarium decemcellulare]